MKGRDKIVLEKIANYAEQTLQFAEGADFERFSSDAKTIPLACSILVKLEN